MQLSSLKEFDPLGSCFSDISRGMGVVLAQSRRIIPQDRVKTLRVLHQMPANYEVVFWSGRLQAQLLALSEHQVLLPLTFSQPWVISNTNASISKCYAQ